MGGARKPHTHTSFWRCSSLSRLGAATRLPARAGLQIAPPEAHPSLEIFIRAEECERRHQPGWAARLAGRPEVRPFGARRRYFLSGLGPASSLVGPLRLRAHPRGPTPPARQSRRRAPAMVAIPIRLAS